MNPLNNPLIIKKSDKKIVEIFNDNVASVQKNDMIQFVNNLINGGKKNALLQIIDSISDKEIMRKVLSAVPETGDPELGLIYKCGLIFSPPSCVKRPKKQLIDLRSCLIPTLQITGIPKTTDSQEIKNAFNKGDIKFDIHFHANLLYLDFHMKNRVPDGLFEIIKENKEFNGNKLTIKFGYRNNAFGFVKSTATKGVLVTGLKGKIDYDDFTKTTKLPGKPKIRFYGEGGETFLAIRDDPSKLKEYVDLLDGSKYKGNILEAKILKMDTKYNLLPDDYKTSIAPSLASVLIFEYALKYKEVLDEATSKFGPVSKLVKYDRDNYAIRFINEDSLDRYKDYLESICSNMQEESSERFKLLYQLYDIIAADGQDINKFADEFADLDNDCIEELINVPDTRAAFY